MGCRPWGREESDTTEKLSSSSSSNFRVNMSWLTLHTLTVPEYECEGRFHLKFFGVWLYKKQAIQHVLFWPCYNVAF